MKTLLNTLAVCLWLLLSLDSFGQEEPIPVRVSEYDPPQKQNTAVIHHKGDFGAGIGLDYGGLIGLQVGYSPVKHLVIFAAAGYHMIKFGWQIGAKGLILANTTKNTIRPYGKLMYGNNAVIYIEGFDEYSKTYRGFTPGIGAQLRFGRTKQHGLDLDLNFPIHTSEFNDDYDRAKNDPRFELTQEILPVAFSIGYHHEF